MHDQLLKTFNALVQLSDEEQDLYRTWFKPSTLNKGDYFLRSGEKNNFVGFLNKGLVRYFVYKDEEESTLEFTKEGEFVGEYQSFINRGQSVQSIQAIEDCDMLVVSYDDVQRMFNDTKNGNFIGRMIIEHRFNTMINQLLSLYMHNPEDRYKYFLENYSDLMQRIPQYHIASFIGMKPQSLSRIRKRLMTRIS